MTKDAITALIEAGAIPSSPFGPSSRYQGVPLALHQPEGATPEQATPYVLRRFIAQPRVIGVLFEHTVRSIDRPDSLAAGLWGDPELYWRIADANAVIDPFELTDTPGIRIRIPMPDGS